MKTLRRVIIFCCLVCVCLCLFTACRQCPICETVYVKPVAYNVLECDYSDSITGANHKIEYSYWLEDRRIDIEAEEHVELTIGNETVSGTYQYSQNQMPNNYASHFYKDSNGKRFAIDSNGFPVFYFWGSLQTDSHSSGVCTEQQCIATARDFLNSYVNIDEYEISVEHVTDRGIYEITFTKFLNGYGTTDCAVVAVQNNGSLYSYASFMLGKLPDDSAVEFYPDIAEQAVYQKLDAIYGCIKEDDSSVTYGTPDFKYTVLENGDLAVYCIVDIQCEDCNDGLVSVAQSERVALIIEL